MQEERGVPGRGMNLVVQCKFRKLQLLAIIEALDDWRHYLEGLPNQFEIVTDHKNLEYWRTSQHLTRQ